MEDFIFFLLDGAEEFFRSFPGGRILIAVPGPGLPFASARKGSVANGIVKFSDLYRLFSDVHPDDVIGLVDGLLPEIEPPGGEFAGHRIFVVSEEDMWALADLVWRCL